jgi:catechol 2,3-dioxygenase
MSVEIDSAVKTGFFRPRRLGHANLFVSDLARSMEFYHAVVGLEETYRRPPVRAGFLSNGNTHHDVGMVEVGGPAGKVSGPGLNHFGFELDNEAELVEASTRAMRAGVKFFRTIDHVIARAVYVRDPDGNSNEIYADVTKDWRTVRSGVVEAPPIPWAPGEGPEPSPEPKYHASPELRRVEHAAFHPLRVTHAVIVAADYEGTVRHYVELVGLAPIAGGVDSAFALLSGTCHQRDLSVFRTRPGRAPGLHHVGFDVGDERDLDAARARLKAAGLEPVLELDHATRRSVFIRDPDGILLEFHVNRAVPADRLCELDEGVALYLA